MVHNGENSELTLDTHHNRLQLIISSFFIYYKFIHLFINQLNQSEGYLAQW
jgi:hypothetical protein